LFFLSFFFLSPCFIFLSAEGKSVKSSNPFQFVLEIKEKKVA